MRLARLAIVLLWLFVPALVRADTAAATAWKPAVALRWHRAAVGLLVGGGVCLALGATFAGLAAQANHDALADAKYHPASEDARIRYQIADGAFFLAGGAAVLSGLVLLW